MEEAAALFLETVRKTGQELPLVREGELRFVGAVLRSGQLPDANRFRASFQSASSVPATVRWMTIPDKHLSSFLPFPDPPRHGGDSKPDFRIR